jgi:IclR family pca regulon transcriptional regulator
MGSEGPGATQSIQALERGLAVIEVFSREHPALTLADVARLAGTSRATARRVLLTLERLGYVRCEGRLFSLTPRVLSLGWAYLSSLGVWEMAEPLMRELAAEVEEPCSAATLDLPDIVYVARVPTRRIMSVTLQVGSRLPAHATSMGRVLLAGLPVDELDAYLGSTTFRPYTARTKTDPVEVRAAVEAARKQGWAMVDQELELGLRSAAAPIRNGDGPVIAALNVSTSASRYSNADLRGHCVPLLVETAAAISAVIARSGAPRS